MVKIKAVLKEIFEAEMEEGGELEGICDSVLPTSVSKLPNDSSVNNFIILGDYRASDVPVGKLRDKLRVLEVDVECGAVVKNEDDAEAEAEERCDSIARAVRTILKNNKALVSETYPDGVAKASELMGDTSDFIVQYETLCAVIRILFYAKVVEDSEMVS